MTEQPFGVTPNPRFLFLTATHREALASVVYGVMENRGFTSLIAPPGMGKTTLLFELLQRCGDSVRTVFLFQFQPTPEGLLRNLLNELGISNDGLTFEAMQEKLNDLILENSKKGKRIVVIVDEAQNFPEPVLEVLRMLSNFETSRDKLIHIVLSGQPQLAELLFSPAIEQLRQRISVMAALRPLSASETKDYIDHRLRIAGYRGPTHLFTDAAYERIARYSEGIPRNINNLCFNSLSLGYALKRPSIGPDLVDEVFRDLNLESGTPTVAKENPNLGANLRGRSAPLPMPAASFSAMWPPPQQEQGRGLRFAAGVVSFAAVLCVGIVAVKQYATPQAPVSVSLPVPTPPAPQIETTAASTPPETAQAIPTETTETDQPDPRPVPAALKDTVRKPEPKTRRHEAPAEHVKLVRASRRETIYELCRQNLDLCDVNAINEIQHLNPWLRGSQVEPGEAIRLPLERPRTSHSFAGAKTNSGDKR